MSLAIAHLAGSSLTSAPTPAAAPAPAPAPAPASPRGMFGLSLSTRAPYLFRTVAVPASSPTPTLMGPAQTVRASPTSLLSSTTPSTSPVTPTPAHNSATSTAPLAVPVGGNGRAKEEPAPQRRASVPSSPANMAKEDIWRDGLRTGFLSFSSTL